VQKSDISFEAMLQVRNKLIDAYKEVMNMPI
jgi:flagellar hook-basal body complex protein FliE